MAVPRIAPVTAPETQTPRAHQMPIASGTLINKPIGIARVSSGQASTLACGDSSARHHRISAAAAGTEMLSSSLIGIVSTNADTNAAASVARTRNVSVGGASAAPALA